MNNKDAATSFMHMLTEGHIAMAYSRFVGPGFKHHNPWFPSDAASLQKGMEENEKTFPNKVLAIQRLIGEGDLVAVHSRIELKPDQVMALVHIFRFDNGKIVELWDIGQPVPDDNKNELGMF